MAKAPVGEGYSLLRPEPRSGQLHADEPMRVDLSDSSVEDVPQSKQLEEGAVVELLMGGPDAKWNGVQVCKETCLSALCLVDFDFDILASQSNAHSGVPGVRLLGYAGAGFLLAGTPLNAALLWNHRRQPRNASLYKEVKKMAPLLEGTFKLLSFSNHQIYGVHLQLLMPRLSPANQLKAQAAISEIRASSMYSQLIENVPQFAVQILAMVLYQKADKPVPIRSQLSVALTSVMLFAKIYTNLIQRLIGCNTSKHAMEIMIHEHKISLRGQDAEIVGEIAATALRCAVLASNVTFLVALFKADKGAEYLGLAWSVLVLLSISYAGNVISIAHFIRMNNDHLWPQLLQLNRFAAITVLATVEPSILRTVIPEMQAVNEMVLPHLIPTMQNLLFLAVSLYGVWKASFPLPELCIIALAVVNGIAVLSKLATCGETQSHDEHHSDEDVVAFDNVVAPSCTVEDVVAFDKALSTWTSAKEQPQLHSIQQAGLRAVDKLKRAEKHTLCKGIMHDIDRSGLARAMYAIPAMRALAKTDEDMRKDIYEVVDRGIKQRQESELAVEWEELFQEVGGNLSLNSAEGALAAAATCLDVDALQQALAQAKVAQVAAPEIRAAEEALAQQLALAALAAAVKSLDGAELQQALTQAKKAQVAVAQLEAAEKALDTVTKDAQGALANAVRGKQTEQDRRGNYYGTFVCNEAELQQALTQGKKAQLAVSELQAAQQVLDKLQAAQQLQAAQLAALAALAAAVESLEVRALERALDQAKYAEVAAPEMRAAQEALPKQRALAALKEAVANNLEQGYNYRSFERNSAELRKALTQAKEAQLAAANSEVAQMVLAELLLTKATTSSTDRNDVAALQQAVTQAREQDLDGQSYRASKAAEQRFEAWQKLDGLFKLAAAIEKRDLGALNSALTGMHSTTTCDVLALRESYNKLENGGWTKSGAKRWHDAETELAKLMAKLTAEQEQRLKRLKGEQ